ncbi:hypothetical protein K504DRAFT_266646 [Pleomassaria siparia CBS 279.74]|uniref:Uncharacterized protein n=1 Tax=Pleomassaria siparia CBS 279.74 TaxID=1314801 RepID=A0A6G1KCT2_9PLEO|nr:hypothetical protein K504DRAFT_266646 [Pleomassaria siparia CBS 279.74]
MHCQRGGPDRKTTNTLCPAPHNRTCGTPCCRSRCTLEGSYVIAGACISLLLAVTDEEIKKSNDPAFWLPVLKDIRSARRAMGAYCHVRLVICFAPGKPSSRSF